MVMRAAKATTEAKMDGTITFVLQVMSKLVWNMCIFYKDKRVCWWEELNEGRRIQIYLPNVGYRGEELKESGLMQQSFSMIVIVNQRTLLNGVKSI